ncbi:polysaccharide deacetylase family protein [Aquimarina sp. MMG016]|uniref:polysaccharide deacetylase family protein n=1 Tax=Aquimarina sp. MMG016 TaxID=2822690 RepID=UPI001B39DB79|nr:polysaccharide deacetylase family protein [Aquimarina sp. MMG016]MBQ4821774.1 polysaccharide deacetylase family protein [Aquimarina sp. MMG016]
MFLLKIGLKNKLLENRCGEHILVFHGIDLYGETKMNSRFFSKTYFERFIKYISTNYNVISLEDFYQKNFKTNTLNLALSFDDGYLNNYKYAIPILEKYNIPASFYITTVHKKKSFLWADFLDIISLYTTKKEFVFDGKKFKRNKKNEFSHSGITLKNLLKTLPYGKIKSLYSIFKEDWHHLDTDQLSDYWKLMNAQQIREISKNKLFTIGSHGETHASLSSIPIVDAKKEILTSKQILETICDTSIEEFAFPFGHYTKELADYCLEIGYKKILLVDYNSIKDQKQEAFKNRFVMNPYISLELQLVCLLKGSYF